MVKIKFSSQVKSDQIHIFLFCNGLTCFKLLLKVSCATNSIGVYRNEFYLYSRNILRLSDYVIIFQILYFLTRNFSMKIS